MDAENDTDPTFVPDELATNKLTIGHVECSPTIGKIATALAKAQGKFERVHKDSKAEVKKKDGTYLYSYTYATLADSLAAVSAALAENEIALLQPTCCSRGGVSVTTILAHSSGEWMASDLAMPVEETRAQAVGSAITYARRYALQAFIGIAPDDDDGGDAHKNPPASKPTPKANPPAKKPPPKSKAAAPNGDGNVRERLSKVLEQYLDVTGDQRPAKEILARAAGKPWPSDAKAVDALTMEAAIGGLTRMTNEAVAEVGENA